MILFYSCLPLSKTTIYRDTDGTVPGLFQNERPNKILNSSTHPSIHVGLLWMPHTLTTDLLGHGMPIHTDIVL